METQTWLSRHYKFISVENIIGIFSVSSDDFLHAFLEVAKQLISSDETESIVLFSTAKNYSDDLIKV